MDNSLAKLREYVKRGIFRGVKMHPYCNDFQVDDPAIFPVYETCIELDIPVLYHTGWLNFSDIDANNKSDNVYKYSCIGFPVQFGLGAGVDRACGEDRRLETDHLRRRRYLSH